MDFHDKDFFDKLMNLTEENNKLLRKMWRADKTARAARVLYWLIVIGLSIGAFYYIQPFINQYLPLIKSLQESASSLQGFVAPR